MKGRRHREILDLVRSRRPRTQDEFVAALSERGIDISQGTLSRDLRELGIVRTGLGYAESGAPPDGPTTLQNLAAVVARFLVRVDTAQNLVVLRTLPGGANALAQLLDDMDWPDVVGTIAGDDTIFVATPDVPTAVRVRERLETL